MKKVFAVALIPAVASPATAETIAHCRAHSGCGAHGCDCGMTVKECRAARAEIQECLEMLAVPGSRAEILECLAMAGGGIKGDH